MPPRWFSRLRGRRQFASPPVSQREGRKSQRARHRLWSGDWAVRIWDRALAGVDVLLPPSSNRRVAVRTRARSCRPIGSCRGIGRAARRKSPPCLLYGRPASPRRINSAKLHRFSAAFRVEPTQPERASRARRAMTSASASGVPQVFTAAAMRLGVEESDFLLLRHGGIATQEDLFYKVPTATVLEDYLRQEIHPRAAYQPEGSDSIEVFARIRLDQIPWSSWRRSDAAAALRKLWELSRHVAKRELEKQAESLGDGEPPKKVGTIVLADLEAKALSRGHGPFEVHEKPGPQCMAKLLANFRVEGAWRHLEWEEYTSEDEERRAARLGLVKSERTVRFAQASGGVLSLAVGETPELRASRVEDLLLLQDVLLVRAVSLEFAEIGRLPTYLRLTSEYTKALKLDVPERFRRPTLSEVRLVDRLIHEEILPHVARGVGTVDEGLTFFLGPGRTHRIWDLLKPVPEIVPDQGQERRVKVPVSGTSSSPAPKQPGAARAAQDSPTLCWVCQKPRDDHENRRFCEKGAGKSSKPKRAAGPGKGRKDGKGSGHQGSKTELPANCAVRTPPTPAHRHGQRFCEEFHTKNGSCRGGCNKSHLCPRFVDAGICMKAHAAYDH